MSTLEFVRKNEFDDELTIYVTEKLNAHILKHRK